MSSKLDSAGARRGNLPCLTGSLKVKSPPSKALSVADKMWNSKLGMGTKLGDGYVRPPSSQGDLLVGRKIKDKRLVWLDIERTSPYTRLITAPSLPLRWNLEERSRRLPFAHLGRQADQAVKPENPSPLELLRTINIPV